MQNATDPTESIETALCRSGLYEALALGFQLPTSDAIARLLSEDHNQALADIARRIDDAAENKLASLVQSLPSQVTSRNFEALVDLHRAVFGHIARAQVPLYETEFGTETLFQQPQQLSDIAGFYAAFGLRPNSGMHERVDHISSECEFMAFLTRKQAFAQSENDNKMLTETLKAQRLFLRDHLGRFVCAFANLLSRHAQASFYGALGELCRRFVAAECRRFAVPMGPETLRLRPDVQVDQCFTCGGGQAALQDLDSINTER